MKRLCIYGLFLAIALGPLAAQDEGTRLSVIDTEHYDIRLELVPENAYMRGEARVKFQVLADTVSIPFDLNSRVSLIQVLDEEGEIYTPSFDNFNSSRMRVRGSEAFKAGTVRELLFKFDGTLETEEYAYLDDTARVEKAVITPERALLLSEGLWFPSHNLTVDPATVSLAVTVPLGLTVVGPGALDSIETIGISEVFNWKSNRPLNHVPVAVSRYFRQQFDDGPLPLTFFVNEDFSRALEPFVEKLNSILSFFDSEYGRPSGLEQINLVSVGNVQLPSAGASGLILLDEAVLDRSNFPTMEMARRLALQWWEYDVSIRSGADAWLQDGFATYAALRFVEEELPERFESELAKLSVAALKYEQRAPIIQGLQLNKGTPQYRSIVEAKAAWVLYMLRQLLGRELLDPMLVEWYRAKAGTTVETSDFVNFVSEKSGQDLGWFFLQWVESVGIPEFNVEYQIYKRADGSFRVKGQVIQDIELFRMPLELRIDTKGATEEKDLRLVGKTTTFDFTTETLPEKIILDPKGKILRDSENMQVAVHIALGEEFQQQGEYVSAIREFEKAKVRDPRSSYAYYRMGETFFLQHSYSNAANAFRDALNGDLNPEWVETWTHIHLGKIYDILGQRQRALAEYTKAVNSGIDYNGAQTEAQKYLDEPFTKPKTLIN